MTRDTPSPGRAVGRRRLVRLALPAVAAGVLALSLAVTAMVSRQSWQSINGQADQRFDRLAERLNDEVLRRANLPVYGLRGARGVFAATGSVSVEQFTAYVASRNLPAEFPGTRAFGFLRRVDRGGTAGYTVAFVGPAAWNPGMVGTDVGADPVKRAAIDRAIRAGQSAATGLLPVVRDGRPRPGYWYFVPVYANGAARGTPEERAASLIGVLFAPVVVADALADVTAAAGGAVSLQVFDGDRATPDAVLFDSDAVATAAGSDPGARRDPSAAARFAKTTTATVAGRTWTLRATSTRRFEAWVDRRTPVAIAAGGTVVSALLAGLVWSMGLGWARAVRLAERMTADLAASTARAQATANLLTSQTAALRATAAILRRTGEMARVGGWELDVATRALTWTDQVYLIHDLPVGSPIDVTTAVRFYAPEARSTVTDALEAAQRDRTTWDVEVPLVTATGRAIWVRAQGEAVVVGGSVVKLCGAFQDVTERRAAVEHLRAAATHDRLTGLPNRALLHDRLQQAIHRAARPGHRDFAVLFLDFDRFKHVNDTLGHEAGDELLRQIAGRLRSSLRSADTVGVDEGPSMAARLGGDEFVVILDEIARPDDVTIVAGRLLAVLAEPYPIAAHQVTSTASIGIVTSSRGYGSTDEMLRDADHALYDAKAAGRGRYVVFQPPAAAVPIDGRGTAAA